MQIGGPKGPAGPSGPKPTERVKPSKSEAADKPAVRFDQVLGAEGAKAGDKVSGTNAIADLAAKVSRGELSAQAAAERIVEAIVDKRVGHLEPADRQRLRDSLQRALAEDPMLAAKLARLGGGGDEP